MSAGVGAGVGVGAGLVWAQAGPDTGAAATPSIKMEQARTRRAAIFIFIPTSAP
jgi:hypothetical protein